MQVDDTLYVKIAALDSWSSGDNTKDEWEAPHSVAIAWGFAEASNILIDTAGDAWVVDSGGGCTGRWVESDKAGSRALLRVYGQPELY